MDLGLHFSNNNKSLESAIRRDNEVTGNLKHKKK